MVPKHKVADVLALEQAHLSGLCANTWQLRTLDAIIKCRTQAMGGHIDLCTKCQRAHLFYNSCRNRHCPSCQGHKVTEWVHAREQELLPVPYFHVVFTLPAELNKVALHSPRALYDVLFKSAWQTIKQFGNNPAHLGAQMGMIGVLHTWGQNLSLHPHLHCIVPGGGVTQSGNWKNCKSKGKFLFNVRSMGKVFRAKFVAALRQQVPGLGQSLYDGLFKKQWVIYAKKPFRDNKSVIEYLGRYTHKIAISNHRIRHIDYKNKTVTFSLKDYRHGGKTTMLTLSCKEFIRRLSLHILPKGFTRIRHYGILSSSWKREKLPALQQKLTGKLTGENASNTGKPPVPQSMLHRCPSCKEGILETVLVFDSRGPPQGYMQSLKSKQKQAV